MKKVVTQNPSNFMGFLNNSPPRIEEMEDENREKEFTRNDE